MRLSERALARLAAGVKVPAYDRRALATGIVHLGIGAFHRAHQAVYIDDILARGDSRWGIVGVSLRSGDTRDALAPQDGLYTLLVRGNDAPPRIIGSVREIMVAPDAPDAVLARMSDPAVAIVSLTITEKGYCHDPATGELDENHPFIVADLADPEHPKSAVGMLAAALARRRRAGVAPFTVLCCDNLPSNGKVLHRILARYAALVSPDLGAFVLNEVAAPSTMVDRIVPATTDADRAVVHADIDAEDAWPVVTEPFSQWVVEDRFPAGRPELEAAGVEMVADVAPYEAMKLRMLNGAHSALAYLGGLAGVETVADAMATPELPDFIAALMDDASATLKTPSEPDRKAYGHALLARFRNAALHHRLVQIAMDGSQKLPQRLLSTVRDRLKLGLPIERHALAVAAWMRFVTRTDDYDKPIPVNDPLAARFAAIAGSERNPEGLIRALLAIRPIFGEDLPSDSRFSAPLTKAFGRLTADGSLRTAGAYARR